MKFSFKFSNLVGTVYKQGNILFTPDGTRLVSPVGNRVTVFDLAGNVTTSFDPQNKKNIKSMAMNNKGDNLITVDEDGNALYLNFHRRVVISSINFHDNIEMLRFSPNDKLIAITRGRKLQIWKAPSKYVEFGPFQLLHTFSSHLDDITCLDWSPDSKYVVTGSRDNTIRIQQIIGKVKKNGFKSYSLTGHASRVVSVSFSKKRDMVYSVSLDGALFVWCWRYKNEEEINEKIANARGEGKEVEDGVIPDPSLDLSNFTGSWTLEKRHFLRIHEVSSVSFSRDAELVVIGFLNGTFGLYSLPDVSMIHTLSVGRCPISSIAINPSGEWVAIATRKFSQLVVWEWQSESYLMKQQGHYYDLNCVAYSPNGQLIVSGGDDGKVKVWNARSNFCFITFNEHKGAVNAVAFSPKGDGNAVFSASDDGTIRAFDLIRYRNFRTFVAPQPCQFSSVTLDPSGEIVCAGSNDTFEVYVWSVQTGKLLDVFPGHKGPVSSIVFSPTLPLAVSGSWDGTVRTWDIFKGGSDFTETLEHTSEVITVAFRPDGKEICAATSDGNLNFWDPQESTLKFVIEGRKDIASGREIGQRITSKTASENAFFTSVCYASDGQHILAGGKSKFICIYNIQQQILIKRFQVSHNFSFDGMSNFLTVKSLLEGGSLEEVQDGNREEEQRGLTELPGVVKGDMSKRKVRPTIRTKCLQFSPTGRSFVAATTEGMVIYSLDETLSFDPSELDIDVTPENIRLVLSNQQFLKALIMSFQLNEEEIIRHVFQSIPAAHINLVAQHLPLNFLARLLKFIGGEMETTKRLEFHLTWIIQLFLNHGRHIKNDANFFIASLRTIQRNLLRDYEDISKICESNRHTISYLLSLAGLQEGEREREEAEEENDLQNVLIKREGRNKTSSAFGGLNPFAAESSLLDEIEQDFHQEEEEEGTTSETFNPVKEEKASESNVSLANDAATEDDGEIVSVSLPKAKAKKNKKKRNKKTDDGNAEIRVQPMEDVQEAVEEEEKEEGKAHEKDLTISEKQRMAKEFLKKKKRLSLKSLKKRGRE